MPSLQYDQSMTFSDPKTARIVNRLKILNAVRTEGAISRAALSRTLNINKVSVSEIVEKLLQEGLIDEGAKISGKVGRRATLLSIRKESVSVIGIDIGLKNTTIGIANLVGELVRFERQPTPLFSSRQELTQFIVNLTNRMQSRFKADHIQTLRGCGITINPHITHAPTYQELSSGFAEELFKETALTAACEFNVRSMLLAEQWFGDLRTDQSTFFINWGHHIGAAQIIGEIILSAESEFGHTGIHTQNTCFCGKRGCLESAAGGWRLQKEGNRVLGAEDLSVKQLYSRAERNEALTALFTKAAEAMGEAVAVAANIITPETVIIGGGLSKIDDRYYRIMNETFSLFAAPGIRSSLLISRSALGDRSGILGASVLALDSLIYQKRKLDLLGQTESLK